MFLKLCLTNESSGDFVKLQASILWAWRSDRDPAFLTRSQARPMLQVGGHTLASPEQEDLSKGQSSQSGDNGRGPMVRPERCTGAGPCQAVQDIFRNAG